jgi:pilus assembly protein CpaE
VKTSDLLLLTGEKETVAAVQSVLQDDPNAGEMTVCGTMVELRTRLSRSADGRECKAAIVDIDQNSEHMLSELDKIITTYPHTRLIVVSREFDERLILHAMQAGARHFLRKSAIGAELQIVLERLLASEHDGPQRLGAILSVFSCSGGCGATTLAINLANELHLASGRRVLLIDLDRHYGSIGAYLNIRGKYGFGHILGRQGPIDGHLIQSTAVAYRPGLDVLLSPANTEADVETTLNFDNLPVALEACRGSYGYIIIDAPRVPRPTTADLASLSAMSLLVLQLTVRDVTFAGSMASYLAARGIPRNRILPVANRARRRGPLLRLQDTERAIGLDSLCPIRSDWAKVFKSVNQGRPLSDVAKRSRLRKDYRRLVETIQRQTSNGSH